jgi:glycosyltransferase involved in cell wall biosynthesis
MKANDAPLLLDASRMVWRRWSGMRTTGIDRICLAWTEHYAAQAQAVVVYRGRKAILPFRTSQALFRLLTMPEHRFDDVKHFRRSLLKLIVRHSFHLRDRLDGRGRFWLNPGHTGLDAPGLTEWVRVRNLRPIHLIHDLIPLTHPQFCREGEDERHGLRMRCALDSAAGVIANSQHTLDTLADFAAAQGKHLPPARVAWPGTPSLPMVHNEGTSAPTFVILSTIEGRKNHALLLRVWRRMIEGGAGSRIPRLVIVGRRGWEADDVFAQLDSGAFGDFVVEAGPLDDRHLAEVLAGARALLFPSHAEGYGIPLIEALAAGVPVIASDLPVFAEIGQGVPDLLSPGDEAGWIAAIADYAQPESQRRARQLARIKTFTVPDWPAHFARIDGLLHQLR